MDRVGPDADQAMKALAYGGAAGAVGFLLVFFAASNLMDLRPPILALPFAFAVAMAMGGATALVPLSLAAGGEAAFVDVMVSGSSTPYTEQYSYQQTLVMRGRLDEALTSYEAIIAEENSAVDVRIRAAELYSREAKNHARAEQLFREVIRHPKCTPGEEVYSANRLADLYTGPLEQPGRALVELRRIADRYKGTKVSEQAVAAIRSLKALAQEREQGAGNREQGG